ncbi:MAG: winged helix DNA-binding domain-containing protein [Planctomycetes bacterium]|nr:winged helix DNA-binding domain-containing protein [Planctomycetota bacterium]
MPSRRLTAAQVRAVRILAQGWPSPRGSTLPAQLAATGFLRTLGGADAYLAARARQPRMRAADLDALVTAGEFRVTPAVRGCIYLVPRAEHALCLSIAREQSRARDARDAEKAGIKPGELDAVGETVLATLRARGPLTTDALRRELGPGTVRSLGARGKKVGVSSPLPPALRRLEFAGRIARTPADGRLDHEKYVWCVPDRDPFAAAAADLPGEPTALHARLLSHFVARAGVTTLAAFCDWSGLTQRDAKAALPHAEHEPVAADGCDGEALATPALPALLRKLAKADDAVALLPFADNLPHLAGGVAALVDGSAHGLRVPTWGETRCKNRLVPLGEARHVMFRSVLAEGRIRGFWEYDPDAHTILVRWFDPPGKAARAATEAAAAGTAAFLRDELGHGRSFSLDNDDELRRRLALLRQLGD